VVSAEGIAEGINSQDGLSWQCLKNTVLSEGVCAEGINSAGDSLSEITCSRYLIILFTCDTPPQRLNSFIILIFEPLDDITNSFSESPCLLDA